ncbi:hypothetical protein D3C80_2156250 [compost metagenome]
MDEIAVDQITVHIGQGQVMAKSRRPQHATVEKKTQPRCAVASDSDDRDGALLAG